MCILYMKLANVWDTHIKVILAEISFLPLVCVAKFAHSQSINDSQLSTRQFPPPRHTALSPPSSSTLPDLPAAWTAPNRSNFRSHRIGERDNFHRTLKILLPLINLSIFIEDYNSNNIFKEPQLAEESS